MAEPEKKQPEIPPTVDKLPEAQAAKPEATPQNLNPTEVAKADLDKMRKKIEEERRQRLDRDDLLQKAAETRRDKESWTNNPMNPPNSLIEGTVRATINSGVEEQIQPYLPMLTQSGLGDFANLGAIKQTVKDVIYEHYCKTGMNQDATKNYAEKTLLPEFKSLTETVQRIFQTKIFPFANPLAVIEAFSSFAKLDFCKSGILDAAKFKEFALLDPYAQDFLIKTFEQHLNIQGELTTLSGQEANLALGAQKPEAGKAGTEEPKANPGNPAEAPDKPAATATPEKPAEAKPEIAALFEKGTLKLNSKVRLVIPANAAELDPNLKTALTPALPANLEAANKEIATTYLTAELRKLNLAAGETFEVTETGQWQKIDVQTEKAQLDAARTQAEKAVTTAAAGTGAEKILTGLQKLFEGDNIMGTIIGFILSLMGFKGLEGLTGAKEEEFATLDSTEKQEAAKMKEAMAKLQLNMETMHNLFINPAEMKKILGQKKEKGNEQLSWEDYLTQHLNDEELAELHQKKEFKAEDIAGMILSPKVAPPLPTAPPPETPAA
jgi:hypothetical protein